MKILPSVLLKGTVHESSEVNRFYKFCHLKRNLNSAFEIKTKD